MNIYNKKDIPEHLQQYFEPAELGLEPTFQEYITKLCDIFDEVKRVLKKDGTCFVNLGDSYSNQSAVVGRKDKLKYGGKSGIHCLRGGDRSVPPKSLCQIPSRFAIEMTNPNWVLREDLSEEDKRYVLIELVKRNILNNI